jgi:hypothetical protein
MGRYRPGRRRRPDRHDPPVARRRRRALHGRRRRPGRLRPAWTVALRRPGRPGGGGGAGLVAVRHPGRAGRQADGVPASQRRQHRPVPGGSFRRSAGRRGPGCAHEHRLRPRASATGGAAWRTGGGRRQRDRRPRRAVLPAVAGRGRHHLLQPRAPALPAPAVDRRGADPPPGRRDGGSGPRPARKHAGAAGRAAGHRGSCRAAGCAKHVERWRLAVRGVPARLAGDRQSGRGVE